MIRKKMVESAKKSIEEQASTLEIYGNMQEVFVKMEQKGPMSVILYCFVSFLEFEMARKIPLDLNSKLP